MRKRKMSKKILVLLLVISMVLSSFGYVLAEEHEEEVFELTIFHTNDVHGRLTDGVGMAKIATIVNQYRSENDHVLMVDAGDILHGQKEVNFSEGEAMVQVMNAVGYEYMTAGNHDFNYGYERLIELNEMADFPIFAGNAVYEGTENSIIEKEYDIKSFGDYTVAIFGIATPETMYKSHPDGVAGLEFINPVEYAQDMMTYLEANYDLDFVIALAHLGIDQSTLYEERSTAIAEQVEGIDLIIDGHSHTPLSDGMTVGDSLIVQTGNYGGNLGQVVVTIEDGEIGYEVDLIDSAAAEEYDKNEEVNDIIAAAEGELSDIFSRVIGTTDTLLDGERENVRTKETNLGNLITDAMIKASGADIALTNGGGIRASIQPGDITVGDVVDVLPFGNILVTQELTGEIIMEALEHGTRAYPEPEGGFPQVAGMTYKINPDAAAGERIHSVMIGGEAIDLNRTYIFATNDFLVAGGDDYTMLEDIEIYEEFYDLAEVVIEHIEEMDTVNYEVDGRIQADDTVEDPADEEEPVDGEDDDEEEAIPQTGDQNYYLYMFLLSSGLFITAVRIKKSQA